MNIITEKKKYGVVDKFFDDYTIIVKNMFKKESNISKFINSKITIEGLTE